MKKLSIYETAKALSERGYSVIPCDEKKNPILDTWTPWMSKPMNEGELKKHFSRAKGLGLLMGGKNAITAIDFDLKWDITGNLYERILEKVPTSIYKKCMVNRTTSGGYHWIFKCTKGLSNIKLANRPTTEEEVMKTFEGELASSGDVRKSMKTALNDRCRVLVETRSFSSTLNLNKEVVNKANGYVLFPPSPGYSYIEGKIGELSVEEMEELLTVLRSFNEYNPPKYTFKNKTLGNDVWENANNLDGLKLLTDCGWRVVWDDDKQSRLLRPGQVTSSTSGVYHKDTDIFVCFSTSTIFEPNKGYSPAMLFIELEANGDIKEAKKLLHEKA